MTEAEIRPVLLIPDATPLSLLSLAGPDALDYLFVPGVDVWITDMVEIEVTRDPDPGGDPRTAQRNELKQWFERNSNRIWIQVTDEGTDYKVAMANWRDAGEVPDRKPRWKGLGEKSILNKLNTVDEFRANNEKVVILVDNRNARTALSLMENRNFDLLATRSFLYEIETVFGIENATGIWPIIKLAAGKNEHGKDRAPEPPPQDPLAVRQISPDDDEPGLVFGPKI
jgi:hypothetical protein